jgi:hypothetical protein
LHVQNDGSGKELGWDTLGSNDLLAELVSRKVTVYCEKGAWVSAVKKMHRAGTIRVIHFPYDEGDRLWQVRHGIEFAVPSITTCDTTELLASDDFGVDEVESEKYQKIALLLQVGRRAFDVRHFDSAYKSKAHFFITNDGNYATHEVQLLSLTGIKVVYVNRPEDMEEFIRFIEWYTTV